MGQGGTKGFFPDFVEPRGHGLPVTAGWLKSAKGRLK
jgi:hypothetical protein